LDKIVEIAGELVQFVFVLTWGEGGGVLTLIN
jgi:hypothetical protein